MRWRRSSHGDGGAVAVSAAKRCLYCAAVPNRDAGGAELRWRGGATLCTRLAAHWVPLDSHHATFTPLKLHSAFSFCCSIHCVCLLGWRTAACRAVALGGAGRLLWPCRVSWPRRTTGTLCCHDHCKGPHTVRRASNDNTVTRPCQMRRHEGVSSKKSNQPFVMSHRAQRLLRWLSFPHSSRWVEASDQDQQLVLLHRRLSEERGSSAIASLRLHCIFMCASCVFSRHMLSTLL